MQEQRLKPKVCLYVRCLPVIGVHFLPLFSPVSSHVFLVLSQVFAVLKVPRVESSFPVLSQQRQNSKCFAAFQEGEVVCLPSASGICKHLTWITMIEKCLETHTKEHTQQHQKPCLGEAKVGNKHIAYTGAFHIQPFYIPNPNSSVPFSSLQGQYRHVDLFYLGAIVLDPKGRAAAAVYDHDAVAGSGYHWSGIRGCISLSNI